MPPRTSFRRSTCGFASDATDSLDPGSHLPLRIGMPLIELKTAIQAPVDRVFDLARSIDAHITSTEGIGERAVGGRTSGLIELDETVTWEARHFGIRQRLTSKITEFDRPRMFEDVMVAGAFASMRHVHRFEPTDGGTLMTDEFRFSAPLGLLGRIAECLFLTRYMRRLLADRNQVLKDLAESADWERYLPDSPEQAG